MSALRQAAKGKPPPARKPRPPSRVVAPRKVDNLLGLSLEDRMIREAARKVAAKPKPPVAKVQEAPSRSVLQEALEQRAEQQARYPESLYIAAEESYDVIMQGPQSIDEEDEDEDGMIQDEGEGGGQVDNEDGEGQLKREDSEDEEYTVAYNGDLRELVDGYLGESGRGLERKVLSSLGAGWVWLASAVAVMPRLTPGPHAGWKYAKHVQKHRGMAKIFREAHKQQVGLNGEVCLLLMEAMGSVGFWERAVEVLEAMTVVGIDRGPRHYRAVIRACMDAQQWNPAIAVLNVMQAELGELDPDTEALALSCMEESAQQENTIFRDVWGDLDMDI